MTQTKGSDTEFIYEPKLPLRDWILLPFISVLTICLCAGSTELIANRMFPVSPLLAEDCMRLNDPATGIRGTPNSVCWEKSLEGDVVENRFNNSGYRSDVDFGPKADGTYRIVMVGTSVAAGLRVPEQQTFAVLLPAELSKMTGQKVELYNEGIVRRLPDVIALHFNEVLKFKPDMILWIVTRGDILSTADLTQLPSPEEEAQRRSQNRFKRLWRRAKAELSSRSLRDVPAAIFDRARSSLLLRHFLYQSQSIYVKSYLIGDDHEMGYLKASQSPEWQNRLRLFDVDAAKIASQAKAAGVPLVAVFLPRGPQAAMISMGEWPAGFDPYKLDNELRAIVESHGGTYVDICPGFRNLPNPEQYYFPYEGHPNAKGHAIISELLARELTSGAVPALRSVGLPHPALAQGR